MGTLQIALWSLLFGITVAITCVDVKEKGSGALFSTEELKSLETLTEDEIKSCIALLGKEEMTSEQSQTIWNALLHIYGDESEIPEDSLRQLGWIINGIPGSNFMNMSFTDVDTIASFGKCNNLTLEQLEGLKDAVMEQWRGKEPEDFTSYDLITLHQIICAFNSSFIQMIHPDSYRDAAHELSTITNCPKNVMEELANLAINQNAFGDPHYWTSTQIANVGCVIIGLQTLESIPAEAMEGLTSDIIKCLPPIVFQQMSEAQISRIPLAAASSLTTQQKSVLSNAQKYSLELAQAGTSKKSNAQHKFQPIKILFVVNIMFITFL